LIQTQTKEVDSLWVILKFSQTFHIFHVLLLCLAGYTTQLFKNFRETGIFLKKARRSGMRRELLKTFKWQNACVFLTNDFVHTLP